MYNMVECPPLQHSELRGSPDLSQVNSTTHTSEFPPQVPSTAHVFSSSTAIEEDSYINFSSRNVTLKNEEVFPSVSTVKSLLYITGERESRGGWSANCGARNHVSMTMKKTYVLHSRSRWPRGLRSKSVVARFLGLWVRILPEHVRVYCKCCVLSGHRADQLSHRVCCVLIECEPETSTVRRSKPE